MSGEGTAATARDTVIALGPACTSPVWWRDVAEALSPVADLSAVVLPGRLTRMRQTALAEMDAVVDDIGTSLRELVEGGNERIHLVGVCAGAAVMASVAQALVAAGGLPRLHLINPPDRRLARTMPRLHELSGAQFHRELVAHALIPPELADHPDVLQQLEAGLRADLAVGWQAANSRVEVSDVVGATAMVSRELEDVVAPWAPSIGFRTIQMLDADMATVLKSPATAFASELRKAVTDDRYSSVT